MILQEIQYLESKVIFYFPVQSLTNRMDSIAPPSSKFTKNSKKDKIFQ